MFRKTKINLLLVVLFLLIVGFQTSAALINWPTSPGGTNLDSNSVLGSLIKYIYEWMVALGGLAAFIVLTIAGVQYLTSSGDPGKMGAAKDRIQSAAIGLALLLGSIIFLNIINPELVNLKNPDFDFAKRLGGDCSVEHECVREKTGETFSCSGDSYCKHTLGEGYQCVKNMCSIDLGQLMKVRNCKEVVVALYQTNEDGLLEQKETLEIKPNESIYFYSDEVPVMSRVPIKYAWYDYRTNPTAGLDTDRFVLKISPTAEWGEKTCTALLFFSEKIGKNEPKDYLSITAGTDQYPLGGFYAELDYYPSFEKIVVMGFEKL